jgi:short-chain fatty acids transporter
MIERLGAFMGRLASRTMPDPYVLAVLLTVVTLLAALFFGREVVPLNAGDRLHLVVVEGWFEGMFGGALRFAFQMVFVLVTGFAVANSKPVQRLISVVARAPRDSAQASAIVALVACISGYIHWGLGAVVGAMLARQIGKAWADQGRPLHYPLLGAAAYSGLLVWHGGLSGSAPLKAAETTGFLAELTGAVPVTDTLFGHLNLFITGSLVVTCVLLYYFLTPKSPARDVWFQPAEISVAPRNGENPHDGRSAVIRFLDDSLFVPILVAILASGYLGWSVITNGFDALSLNSVNLTFLALALVLHGSPKSFLAAAAEGARGSVGIILQFPLYFGILGILKSSGLIVQLSEIVTESADSSTLAALTFLSAGGVNMFVPSGGGQWAVQGPVMMEAARSLGAEPAKVVVALAHGDAWTNMLQPFWALPLLGIMGLQARDIVGYTTLLFLISGPVILTWLFLF